MELAQKIGIVTMIALMLMIITSLVPSNITILFYILLTSGAMVYLAIAILKDDSPGMKGDSYYLHSDKK